MSGNIILIDLRSGLTIESEDYKICETDDTINISLHKVNAIYNIRLGTIANNKSLSVSGDNSNEVVLSHTDFELKSFNIVAKTLFIEEDCNIHLNSITAHCDEIQIYGVVNTCNMEIFTDPLKVGIINYGVLNVSQKYNQTNGSLKNTNTLKIGALSIKHGGLVLNESQANWTTTKQSIDADFFCNLGSMVSLKSTITCDNAQNIGMIEISKSRFRVAESIIFDESSSGRFQLLTVIAKQNCQIAGMFGHCGVMKFSAEMITVTNTARINHCSSIMLSASEIIKCQQKASFNRILQLHAGAPHLYIDASLNNMKEIDLCGGDEIVINSLSHISSDKIYLSGRDIFIHGHMYGSIIFHENISLLYLAPTSTLVTDQDLNVECHTLEAYGKLNAASVIVRSDLSIKTTSSTEATSISMSLIAKFIELAGRYKVSTVQLTAIKTLHLTPQIIIDSDLISAKSESIQLDGVINSNIDFTARVIDNRALINNDKQTKMVATEALIHEDQSKIMSDCVEFAGRTMVHDGQVNGGSIAEFGEKIIQGENSHLTAPITAIRAADLTLGGQIIGEELNADVKNNIHSLSTSNIEANLVSLEAGNQYTGHTKLMGMNARIIAGNKADVAGQVIAGESFTIASREMSVDANIATHQLTFSKVDGENTDKRSRLRIGNQSVVRASSLQENLDDCVIAGEVNADVIKLDSQDSTAMRPGSAVNYYDVAAIKTNEFHCDGSVKQELKSTREKSGFYIESERIEFDRQTQFNTTSPVNMQTKKAVISGEFSVPIFNLHSDNIGIAHGAHITRKTDEVNLLGKSDDSKLHLDRDSYIDSKKTQIQNIHTVTLDGVLSSLEILIKISELQVNKFGRLGSMESKLNLHAAHVKLLGDIEALEASIKCSRTFIQVRGHLKVIKGNIASLLNINLGGIIEAQQINLTSGLRLGLGLQFTNFTVDNALINLNVLPRLLHLPFLANVPKDIKNKKIDIFNANYLFYSLQSCLSLLKLFLPILSQVANTAISVICLIKQAQILIELINNLYKNKKDVELVDVLPLLITLKNMVISGVYVFSTELPELPNDFANLFTTAQAVDVLSAFAAAGSVFSPANYSDAIINVNLFSPQLTYTSSQRGIFTFSFASPNLAVNNTQVGVGFLGNVSPQVVYNDNLSSPFVFQDAPTIAHTYQVASQVYDQASLGKVQCKIAVIEENYATPHDIEVDEKLDLTYETAENEEDLLKLSGIYSHYQPKNPANFTVSYKTDHAIEFHKSENYAYSVNFEGSSITVDAGVNLTADGRELGLTSNKGSIEMDGALKAESINIRSEDSYTEKAGSTDSKDLSIVAENDINITCEYVDNRQEITIFHKHFYFDDWKIHSSSNTADDGVIVAKHGNVVVDASVVKLNDFGQVSAGGDITVECESVPIATNDEPDRLYVPGIVQGGDGQDHNDVGLTMHADGTITNIGSTIGAKGDYIVDGNKGVTAEDRHNVYCEYSDDDTDWTGEETVTQVMTERIQRPKFESVNGSGYINSQNGKLDSQCGEYIAAKSTVIHANTLEFKDYDVRTETTESSSWLGVVPLSDRDEVDDKFIGQKFVSPESLQIKVEQGDLVISNSTIETAVFVTDAVNGQTTISQDVENHYVHQEYYSISANIGPLNFSFSAGGDQSDVSFSDPVLDGLESGNIVNTTEGLAGKINAYSGGAGMVNDSVGVGISKTETDSHYQTPGENYIRVGLWHDSSLKGVEIDAVPCAAGELTLDGGQTLTVHGQMLSYSSQTDTDSVGISYEPTDGSVNANASHSSVDSEGKLALPCLVKIGKLDLGKDAVINLDNAEVSVDEIHGSIATLNMTSECNTDQHSSSSYSVSTTGDVSYSESNGTSIDVVPTYLEVKDLSDCHIHEVNSVGAELRGDGFATNKPDSIHQTDLKSSHTESGFSISGNFMGGYISSVGYTDLSNGVGVDFQVNIPYNLMNLAAKSMHSGDTLSSVDLSDQVEIVDDASYSNNIISDEYNAQEPDVGTVTYNANDASADDFNNINLQSTQTNADIAFSPENETENVEPEYPESYEVESINPNINLQDSSLPDSYNLQEQSENEPLYIPLPDDVSDLIDLTEPFEISYRGDTRDSNHVFEEGFTAKGDNLDINDHIKGEGGQCADDSGYVSTSKYIEIAQQFPIVTEPGTYASNVYVVVDRGDNVNVNEVVPDNRYADEHEISYANGIPPEDIKGAYTVTREITEDGVFGETTISDEMIKNPNYLSWTNDEINMASYGVVGAASMAYTAYQDAVSLDNAYDESVSIGNPDPFIDDSARVAGAWSTAYTAGEVCLEGAAAIGFSEVAVAGAVGTIAYHIGGELGEWAYDTYKDYAHEVIDDAVNWQVPEFTPHITPHVIDTPKPYTDSSPNTFFSKPQVANDNLLSPALNVKKNN